MSPFLFAARHRSRATSLAALLMALLATPVVGQNPGPGTFTIGNAGSLGTNDTTLNPGLVTLTNGTTLNLNGLTVPGGFSGMYRATFINYNVNNLAPELENLSDSRASFFTYFNNNAQPVTPVPFYGDVAPTQINYVSTNNAPFAALPVTATDNVFGRFRAELTVTAAGAYTFATRSDDATVLYVDGQLVVNNNQFQGMTTRSTVAAQGSVTNPINLTAGTHQLEAYFTEAGGGAGFILGYRGPDNPGAAIDNSGDANIQAALIPTTRLAAHQNRIAIANDVTVAANATATINVSRAHGLIFNGGTGLTMNSGATLNIGSTGATLADGSVFFTSAVMGAGTKTFNTVAGDIGLGTITGAGGTIVKTGAGGSLILDTAPLPGGTTIQIQAGQVVAVPDIVNNLNNLGDGNAVQFVTGGVNPTLQLRQQTGNTPYNNPLTVNVNGTLELNSNNTVDTAAAAILFTNTTTLVNNSVLTIRPLSSTNAFRVDMGPIVGAGKVDVFGNAHIRFTGNNTFTAPAGQLIQLTGNPALEVLSGSSLGNAANAVNVTAGATLSFEGTGAGVTRGNPVTLTGGGSGAGGARAGALEAFNGLVTMTGAVTIAGNTTIGTRTAAGQLVMNGNLALGSNTLTLNAAGGNITAGGVISGTGAVTKTGGGSLILTGNNNYSGATNINGGTAEARGPSTGAFGTGALTVGSGATALVTGASALGSPSSITLNGGALRFDVGTNTVTNNIAAITTTAGSAVTVTTGTVNLANANVNLPAAFVRQGLVERFSTGGLNQAQFTATPFTQNPLNLGANSGVQTTVRQGQTATTGGPGGPAPGTWADNTSYFYTGQIRVGASGTLSFAENIDDFVFVRLFRSGTPIADPVLNDTVWNVAAARTVTGLTPGEWLDVDIRLYNGGGGAGAVGAINNQTGWGATGGAANFGFGISDADTAGSTNGFNYFKPGDTTDTTTGYAGLGGTRRDPMGADRFRTVQPASTASVAAGASLTVGRFTGGGDISVAAGAPGAAITLAAANTSAITNFGVTGTTGSATLTTNAGHELTVSNLSIPAGTTLNKAGPGSLFVNGTGGTGTGTLAINAGQVGGTGTIPEALTVNSGGGVAPGITVGKLTVTGATTFAGGGRMLFDYNSVDQTAVNLPANFGVTHDHLTGTGALNITATSGTPFVIQVGAYTFSPAPTPVNYTIGTFASVTGFAANAFTFQGAFTGTPTIALQGNNLVLTITPIPEPVHLLLLCAGGACIARWVRRRRAAAFAALVVALLAAPAPAQTVNATIGANNALTNDTSLTNGQTVTLGAGGILNLNGTLIQGGLTGVFNNNRNVVNGNGDPNFLNRYSARALHGLYSVPVVNPLAGMPFYGQSPTVTAINFPSTNFEPFPGAPLGYSDNLLSRFTGALNITTAGQYWFATRSDDGSIVYVDGTLVVYNDRFQGMTTRSGALLPASTTAQPSANPIVNLSAGQHRIEIYHVEGGGGAGLIWGYNGPDNNGGAAGTDTFGGDDATIQGRTPGANALFGDQGRVNLTANNNRLSVTGTTASPSVVNITNAQGVIMNGLTMANNSQLTINTAATATASALLTFQATTLTGGGTFTFNTANGDLALGAITGGGTVVKDGPGNMFLDFNAPSAAITWSVRGGRVVVAPEAVNNANHLGPGAVAFDAGGSGGPTVQLRSLGGSGLPGSITYNTAFNVNASGTIEFATNDNGTANNFIRIGNQTGAPNIVLAGNSTLTLTVISQGTNLRSEIYNNITGSGTLVVNSPSNSGGAVWLFGTGNTFTATTPITVNSGAALLAGFNNTAGAFATLGAATNTVTVNSGGSVSFNATRTVANAMTLSGGGATGTAGALEVGPNPLNPTFVTGGANNAPNSVTFSGNITLAGNTTIGVNANAGVAAANPSMILTSGLAVPSGQTLTFNAAGGVINANGVISGAGNIAKDGGNNLVLGANNTHTGTTTVNAGTMVAQGTGGTAIGTGNVTVNGGGTLRVAAANAFGSPSAITVNGTSTALGTLNFDIGAANTATVNTGTVNVNAYGALNVTTGTLNMPNASITMTPNVVRQGLLERFSTGGLNQAQFTATPFTQNPLNVGANNGVQTTVRQGQTATTGGPGGPAPGTWADNTSYFYTGQIRVGASGTLSFAENIDDFVFVRLFRSGTPVSPDPVLNDTVWNVATARTVTGLTPGEWLDVDIRLYNGGGGAGAVGDINAQTGWGAQGAAANYGFAISEANTSGSTNGFNYFKPGDTTDATTGYAGLGGTRRDPMGADRFRFVTLGGTVNVAAGSSMTVGRLTGGGDVSMAAATTGAALTLSGTGANGASAVGNLSVTGTTGSATLTTNAGHALTVSNLSIAAGATLTKAGAGILNVNGLGGTGTGTLAVTGGSVGGTGTIPGALTVNSGGVAPGITVGKITVAGATTFAGGGRYLFDYNSVDQTAVNNPANFGITHDHLTGTGALNITATSGTPFVIQVGAFTSPPHRRQSTTRSPRSRASRGSRRTRSRSSGRSPARRRSRCRGTIWS